MKALIKRFFYFFSGLGLMAFLIYYLIMTLEIPKMYEYILSLETYDVFWYIQYIIIGFLLLVSISFLIFALRPSHNRRRLLWKTHSGDLEVSKKSIESYIVKSISEFDHIRLHNIRTTLQAKGNQKLINSDIDVLWLPSHDSSEASLEEINQYIKFKLEDFINADIDGININVIDQAKTDKRVI